MAMAAVPNPPAKKAEVVIDLDDLELGEIEEFEELSGVSIAQVQSGLPAKAVTVLVWITQRKLDPNYTLEMARKVKLSSVDFAEDDANPTVGGS